MENPFSQAWRSWNTLKIYPLLVQIWFCKILIVSFSYTTLKLCFSSTKLRFFILLLRKHDGKSLFPSLGVMKYVENSLSHSSDSHRFILAQGLKIILFNAKLWIFYFTFTKTRWKTPFFHSWRSWNTLKIHPVVDKILYCDTPIVSFWHTTLKLCFSLQT